MEFRKMLLLPAIVLIIQVYLAAANCEDCKIPIPELTLTIGGHLNTCPYCEHIKLLQAAPLPIPPLPPNNPSHLTLPLPIPDSHNLPLPNPPLDLSNPTHLPLPDAAHIPLPNPSHLPLPNPPHQPLPFPGPVPVPLPHHLQPLPIPHDIFPLPQPLPNSVLPYLKQLILTDPSLKENNLDILLLLLLSEGSIFGTNCPPGCQCTCNSVCPYCQK